MTKRKSTRWCADRRKISKEATNDKQYMLSMPFRSKKSEGGDFYICLYVKPDETYGEFTGRELISKYLSKFWRSQRIGMPQAVRQAKYEIRCKHNDGITNRELQQVTRLGNEKNDMEFLYHKHKLEQYEANNNLKGKQEYIDWLNAQKKKLRFDVSNEAEIIKRKKKMRTGKYDDESYVEDVIED